MEKFMVIVEVMLFIPTKKTFFYYCNSTLKPNIGSRVLVPFKSRKLIGIIFSINKKTNLTNITVKKINKILDKSSIINKAIINLLIWSSDYYFVPIGTFSSKNLPKWLRLTIKKNNKKKLYWTITTIGKETNLESLKNTPKQKYAISILKKKNIQKNTFLTHKIHENIFKKLQKKGLCTLKRKEKNWNILSENYALHQKNKTINSIERKILEKILENNLNHKIITLTGTDFFSKIKLYSLILKLLFKKKKQTLIITHNISTIFQIKKFLNKNINIPIDVYHAELNHSEQEYVWNKSKNVPNLVVISTKKGVFIPFFQLGLIILDKENSINYMYKENSFHNTRNVAIIRSFQEKIPIILESLTPDLSTLKNLHHNKYYYFNLHKINKEIIKKTINLIDLKQSKCYGIFSNNVIKYMYLCLKKEKTIILVAAKNMIFFLVLMCINCSGIMRCNKCNNVYTIDQSRKKLFCTNCLVFTKLFSSCTYCNSEMLHIYKISKKDIKFFLFEIFKKIQFLYFNLIEEKNTVKKSINIMQVTKKSPRIILISDTLEVLPTIENIKTIVFLNLDYYFNYYKFRAIEIFSHLSLNSLYDSMVYTENVTIFVQTQFSKHTLLNKFVYLNFDSFSNKLLKIRKINNLPPFTIHVVLKMSSIHLKNIEHTLSIVECLINKNFKKQNPMLLIMPFKISKINKFTKKYSSFLLLQHHSKNFLNVILNYIILATKKIFLKQKVKLSIIINPKKY